MKLDLLVISVHPDDAELACAGTIIQEVKKGRKVGILDLTRGELGTRGTPELRISEAEASARVLGLAVRRNLGFADGFFTNDKEHQLQLIRHIRDLQPEIVITNAVTDRHPDHGRASRLAHDALFLSGLAKIETTWEGDSQQAWRPRLVLQYIQDSYIKPDIIVDVTAENDQKIEAIKCFHSQFFQSGENLPETYISKTGFFESVMARSRELGKNIGATFGEGYTSSKLLGVSDLFMLR